MTNLRIVGLGPTSGGTVVSPKHDVSGECPSLPHCQEGIGWNDTCKVVMTKPLLD